MLFHTALSAAMTGLLSFLATTALGGVVQPDYNATTTAVAVPTHKAGDTVGYVFKDAFMKGPKQKLILGCTIFEDHINKEVSSFYVNVAGVKCYFYTYNACGPGEGAVWKGVISFNFIFPGDEHLAGLHMNDNTGATWCKYE